MVDFVMRGNSPSHSPVPHSSPPVCLLLPLLRVHPFPSLRSAFGLSFFFLFVIFFFPLTVSLSRYMGPSPSFLTCAHHTLLPLTNMRHMPVHFSFSFSFHLLTASPSCSPLHHITLCHVPPCRIALCLCHVLPCHVAPSPHVAHHIVPSTCIAHRIMPSPRTPVATHLHHALCIATVVSPCCITFVLPCCVAFASPCCIAFMSSHHSPYRAPSPSLCYSGMSPCRAALHATLSSDLGRSGGDRVRVRR